MRIRSHSQWRRSVVRACLAAATLLVASVASAFAQESVPMPVEPPTPPPSPPAITASPPSPPQNNTYNSGNDYPTYSRSGGYPGGENYPSARVGDQYFPQVRPKMIFFPPNPPPLGVEVNLADVSGPGRAPSELAGLINEAFYAPLSTHLIERDLKENQRERLDEYRDMRTSLLEQLRARLGALRDADAATRLRGLEFFASEQTPKIVELEKAAEQMRRDLYERGWGADGSGNWYGLRDWRLGKGTLKKPREEMALFEFQVMRAAAYYQEGLSPAQRRLLREIAMEMEEGLFHSDRDVPVSSPFVYFSPEMARVIFSADLPAPLRAQIDAYRADKDAIKRVLRDTVFESDRAMFTSSRNEACEELARHQEKPIAALEQEAEDIRRALSRAPGFERPSSIFAVPPELQAEIETYQAEKKAFTSGLMQRVQAIGAKVRRPPTGDPVAIKEWIAERGRALQEASLTYRRENSERVARLDALLDRIRVAIENAEGGSLGLVVGSLDDRFLASYLALARQRQSAGEYWVAIYEPGLSPEQRRLLFGAAVAGIGLPLPGAEKQPTSLPGTILR